MMRTTVQIIGAGFLAAALAAWPSGAQEAGDEYAMLSVEAGRQGTVAVLVTGWHPVTGEDPDATTGAPGGPVAVTGDEFVGTVGGRGRVTEVRRYEHLPVIAMKMDAAALAAAKGYDAGVRIWRDRPVVPYLDDSGPMVGAPGAHRRGYTGKGAYVAVVDTGVDVSHPFIAGRPVLEACFSDRCPNGAQRMVGPGAARPVDPHGTHVAGIALGRGHGMAGVAPEAGLIAVNVFSRVNGEVGANNSTILGALDWLIGVARSGRVRLAAINLSLGSAPRTAGRCRDRIYELAMQLLARERVVIVAAAGNDGESGGLSHPACVNGIVSVGAIDKDAAVADFSNSAAILDMLAPGVDIVSAVPRSQDGAPFEKLPGTSMAAPHVAGAFALLWQASPRASLWDHYQALVTAGRPVADGRNGIRKPALDIAAALAALGVGGAGSEPPKSREGVWQPVGD